jgi:hypothetical protein
MGLDDQHTIFTLVTSADAGSDVRRDEAIEGREDGRLEPRSKRWSNIPGYPEGDHLARSRPTSFLSTTTTSDSGASSPGYTYRKDFGNAGNRSAGGTTEILPTMSDQSNKEMISIDAAIFAGRDQLDSPAVSPSRLVTESLPLRQRYVVEQPGPAIPERSGARIAVLVGPHGAGTTTKMDGKLNADAARRQHHDVDTIA